MITRLAIAGYRSIRALTLRLAPLTIVTGANGSGKSNLYRALRLLAEVAQGRIGASLASEGGIGSAMWAGDVPVDRGRTAAPRAIRLGFASEDYGYAIDLGRPNPGSGFGVDPEIKLEAMWTSERLGRANMFAERRGPMVRLRDAAGVWETVHGQMAAVDSMMTHCADPKSAAELLTMREHLRGWRFYDHWRTDADAPARRPRLGTFTPVLANDGGDLAAAVGTIRWIGDPRALADAISDAFPGAELGVVEANGVYGLEMAQPGVYRPLTTSELSEGTLRYLLLIAALLTPRPPGLMVLNEPEASLHPDLIAALARLIARAADATQIVLVTHSAALVRALAGGADTAVLALEKVAGETTVPEHEAPGWSWPQR